MVTTGRRVGSRAQRNCCHFKAIRSTSHLVHVPVYGTKCRHWQCGSLTQQSVVCRALLIAGSAGWGNYRHQADVCHAYQVLVQKGIAPERIVVMMADDLAHNPSNPQQGSIFNCPGCKDVYAGVPHDYTGGAVNAVTFLDVLMGNADAVAGQGSGRVIASGPEDRVFVYYADHGAPGMLTMSHMF